MGNKKNIKVRPYTDIFVRYLLGDEKNSDLLISFINAVNEDYKLPLIKSVKINNPYNLDELAVQKGFILDVKATDDSGQIYNIEIQTSGNEVFKHRALYYWAKLYSSQIERGGQYYLLKPTISINLIDFNLLDSENTHSCFSIHEKNNHELMLSNHLTIHFIELRKFIKESNFESDYERWLGFFKYEGVKEDIMQTIIEDSTIFSKAHEKFEHFTHNDKLLEFYEMHSKWESDYNTGIHYAEQKGIEKGREKERIVQEEILKEKDLEAARKMIKKGMSVEDINYFTNLSISEIEKIIKATIE